MDQLTAFGISAYSNTAEVSSDRSLAPDTVQVGVLHSLTGPMAISEVAVKNATMLAIDEINAAGGVMGHRIVPVVEDGASDPVTFAAMARKLIQDDKVATVFGGWTSASRKAMLPEFESLHSLLWYPVQFEGNECSPNIMYSGAQPNQQLLPALQWAFDRGYTRIFLLGSDYVFPRTANLILKKHIIAGNGEVVGEEYVPFDVSDFSGVIATIHAAKPQIIFNTINGVGNLYFFRAMAEAGIPPSKLPVMSFSIAEQESKAIGPDLLKGSYAAWNYFQSIDSPANRKLVAAYRAKFGSDSVVDDPMAHGYMDVYKWAAAAEKAKSFDPNAVRKAAPTLEWTDVGVGEAKFTAYQSLIQRAYIGELQADGQFKILWRSKGISKGLIYPEPYDPLAFPGQVCLPS